MTNNVNAVKEKLEEMDFVCTINEISKPDKTYKGFVIKPKNGSLGISEEIDAIEDMVERFGVEGTVIHLISTLNSGSTMLPIKDKVTDYAWIKEHLAIQPMSIKDHETFLETVPHVTLEDLAFIARVTWEQYSAIVNNGVLYSLGVDRDTLFADAIRASEKRSPITIQNMSEVLGVMGVPIEPDTMPLYVCKAGEFNGAYGASVLIHPTFIPLAFQKIGGSFYILPSSQHEVLLYKDNQNISKEELRETVCTINESEVEIKDRLSDSIYYCDGTSIKKIA